MASEQDQPELEAIKKAPEGEKAELDARARQGETVVPSGTRGKSLEAQIHLAEGNNDSKQILFLCLISFLLK